MELKTEQQMVREAVVKLSNKGFSPQEIKGEMRLKQDLGIDSLQFIQLILEIESRSARRIFNVQMIAQIRTLDDLCVAVS
ncbi:MAG: acyl carrier protein, partial [Candidatus Angelobacter sp.]